MAKISPKQARAALDQESDNVSPDTMETLLAEQARIEQKVKSSGRLSRFSTDIRLMMDMVGDYWRGDYRAVPWKSIAAVAGALLYVLNPMDLIPDLILGFGLIDDAGVVAACLTLMEADLHRYAAWKATHLNRS